MVNVTTEFKCDMCGHKFMALDIERHATAFPMPARCPKCGSRHTYPTRLMHLKGEYREIWQQMDKYDLSH